MTWPEAGFGSHAIRGPVADLARPANLVESKLATPRLGSSVRAGPTVGRGFGRTTSSAV